VNCSVPGHQVLSISFFVSLRHSFPLPFLFGFFLFFVGHGVIYPLRRTSPMLMGGAPCPLPLALSALSPFPCLPSRYALDHSLGVVLFRFRFPFP